MIKNLVPKLLIAISTLLISSFVFANTELDTLLNLSKKSDMSLSFLSLIFGSVNGVLPESNVVLTSIVIKYMNYGLISIVSLLISYSFINSAIKTSNQGKMLGKQGGGVAAVFRSVTSIGALTPLSAFKGYSAMQVFIFKIVVMGVALANQVWTEVIDFVEKEGSILTVERQLEKTKGKKSFKFSEPSVNMVRMFAYCAAKNKSIISNSGELKFSAKNCDEISFTINSPANSDLVSQIRAIKDFIDFEYTQAMILSEKIVPASKSRIEPSEAYYAEKNALKILELSIRNVKSDSAKESPANQKWLKSWIMAGSQFNRLVNNSNNSLSAKNNKPITINSSYYSKNSYLPSSYSIAFEKPRTEIRSESVNLKDPDLYFDAIKSVIPIQLVTSDSDEKALPMPKNVKEVSSTISALKAKEKAEERGKKTLTSAGFNSDFFSGLNIFASKAWETPYDASSGPLNIVERDKVITRDIQLFLLSIYKSWLVNIQPSKYRYEINPLARLRAFGMDNTIAGIDFLADIIQDTFYAAMSAQMKATSKSMQFMIKSLIFKGITFGVELLATAASFIIIIGPIIKLVINAIAIGTNAVSIYFTHQSAVPQLLAPLVSASRVLYVSLATSAAIPPILLGMLFATYVPFLPFVVFLFCSIGWFITIAEAIMSAPIVAAGISNPQGHDFLGKSQQIIMLLAAIFIRPVCIVIGLIMAIYLFNVASTLLDFSFFPFVESYVKGISAKSFGRSIAVLIIMYMYGYLLFCLVKYCFSLIYVLPNYVVRWIGMMPVSGGEEESIESTESSLKEAYASGLTGASSGASAMKR